MTSRTYDPRNAAFLNQMAAEEAQLLREKEALLEQASRDVEESKKALDVWQAAIRLYQEDTGTNGPDRRYASLGTTEAMDLWADEHDGIIVVSELAAAMAASGGQFKTKQQARKAIDDTVRKNKRYQKQEPGVWQRIKRPKPRR